MNILASPSDDAGWSPRHIRHWVWVVVIWILVLAAYVATDRPLKIVDVEGVALLPVSIWQEGNLDLDEYADQLKTKKIIRQHRGRFVSSFSIWPAFQLLPVYLAVGLVDEFPSAAEIWPAQQLAAQFFMSLTTLLVGLLAVREYGRMPGILAGLAFGFGTLNWFMLSQLAFSNGLVQFWLALALYLTFGKDDPATWKVLLAFCALVVAVAMRLHMALLALPWMLYLFHRLRRKAVVPATAAAILAATIALTNLWYSGNLLGMYGRHVGKGWIEIPSTDLLTTLAANLISPARGLFIFAPWVVLALTAPLLTRGRQRVMHGILLAGWALHLLALSNHRFWHGGGCGGPRLTADMLPVLALLAAPAIKILMDRKSLVWIPLLLIGGSAVISGAHAFSPPPVWENYTVPVSACPTRIFDWQDALVTFPFSDQSIPYERHFPIRLQTPRRNEMVRGAVTRFRWHAIPEKDLTYSVELCVHLQGNTFLPKVISTPADVGCILDLDYRSLRRFNPGSMSWRATALDRRGRIVARSGWRAFWWNYGYPRQNDNAVAGGVSHDGDGQFSARRLGGKSEGLAGSN